MSYALRKDGLGFRSINSPSDVKTDETFSAGLPTLSLPPYFAPVSPWQIRKVLNAAGLRSAAEAAVAAADQTTKDAWEFASMYERKNPMIARMEAALGKTPAEIDALFVAAASM